MKKVLILAVDYDDDISRAGVETPVLGYTGLLDAALKFGTVFPDDSDLNVLFHALHLYNQLKSEGYDPEISLVSGSSESHVESGRRIGEQLRQLLEKVGTKDVILVLDSVEDEFVIPIVQSQANIVAVERVVVEQLRGVEETYVLLGKYIRKAIEDPKYSKVFFGLPGFLILVYVLISASPYASYAWEITLGVLGAVMIVRGFHIPELVMKRWYSSSVYRVATVLSMISLSAGIALTIGALMAQNYSADVKSISMYIKTLLPFVTLSLVVTYTGKLTVRVLRRSIRMWRDIVAIVFVVIAAFYINDLADVIVKYPELNILTIVYDLKLVNTIALISLALIAVYVTLSYVERHVTGSGKRT